MTLKVTLYHNPRCSKSRAAMALLQERSAEIKVVQYQDNPPDLSTLVELHALLGVEVTEMVRMKEASAYVGGKEQLPDSDAGMLDLLVTNPALLERPILIAEGRAIIGRPTERVSEFLDTLSS